MLRARPRVVKGDARLGNNHAVLQLWVAGHSLSKLLVLWGQMLAVSTPADKVL